MSDHSSFCGGSGFSLVLELRPEIAVTARSDTTGTHACGQCGTPMVIDGHQLRCQRCCIVDEQPFEERSSGEKSYARIGSKDLGIQKGLWSITAQDPRAPIERAVEEIQRKLATHRETAASLGYPPLSQALIDEIANNIVRLPTTRSNNRSQLLATVAKNAADHIGEALTLEQALVHFGATGGAASGNRMLVHGIRDGIIPVASPHKAMQSQFNDYVKYTYPNISDARRDILQRACIGVMTVINRSNIASASKNTTAIIAAFKFTIEYFSDRLGSIPSVDHYYTLSRVNAETIIAFERLISTCYLQTGSGRVDLHPHICDHLNSAKVLWDNAVVKVQSVDFTDI